MITTVAFDADNTLVDTHAAVAAALKAVAAVVNEPALTFDVFWADGAQVWEEIPEQPAHKIRRTALHRTLARAGRESELDEILDLFFEVRFANSRPFPEVLDVLAKLRVDYRLGYATNGTSRTELCGLSGQFDFELYALVGGVPKKPARDFYVETARLAGAHAEQITYVGDDYEFDVVGPAAFGMRTVWLNPTGAPVPGQVQPDAVIQSLSELPRILAE